MIDQFAGFILRWIPFYYLAKLVFLLFLLYPKTRGAEMVYKYFILPNYINADVEGELKKVEQVAKGLADDVVDKVNEINQDHQDDDDNESGEEEIVEINEDTSSSSSPSCSEFSVDEDHHGFTEEECAQVKRIFDICDKNDDG